MTDIYTASDEEIAKMSELPEQEDSASSGSESEDTQTEATESVASDENTPESTDSEDNSENVDNQKDSDIKENNQEPSNEEIDYKGFYDTVMAPIKANGHTIQLKSQDEVVKLIQQGANYTKKMQELAPYRKAALMLKDNDLLDENKLSFLIDLQKGDSAAVSKFLKDNNIDPLDIDTDKANEYKPGTHLVSDSYIKFKDAYENLCSTEQGSTTAKMFDSYDEQSQHKLIERPELMQMLHEQVQAGFYQTVCDEITRQKMLGTIPANMSFLDAYERVGTPMLQSQLAEHQNKPITSQPRVAPTGYANSRQAKSANPTKISNSKVTSTTPNYLSMSDEEFEKQFGNIHY